jgi:hypothetical protein
MMAWRTVRVHVPDQDLDIDVMSMDDDTARTLVAERLDGIDHNVQWVQRMDLIPKEIDEDMV